MSEGTIPELVSLLSLLTGGEDKQGDQGRVENTC